MYYSQWPCGLVFFECCSLLLILSSPLFFFLKICDGIGGRFQNITGLQCFLSSFFRRIFSGEFHKFFCLCNSFVVLLKLFIYTCTLKFYVILYLIHFLQLEHLFQILFITMTNPFVISKQVSSVCFVLCSCHCVFRVWFSNLPPRPYCLMTILRSISGIG